MTIFKQLWVTSKIVFKPPNSKMNGHDGACEDKQTIDWDVCKPPMGKKITSYVLHYWIV